MYGTGMSSVPSTPPYLVYHDGDIEARTTDTHHRAQEICRTHWAVHVYGNIRQFVATLARAVDDAQEAWEAQHGLCIMGQTGDSGAHPIPSIYVRRGAIQAYHLVCTTATSTEPYHNTEQRVSGMDG